MRFPPSETERLSLEHDKHRKCRPGGQAESRCYSGGWDGLPASDMLVRDLGTEMAFELAAEIWAAYQRLDIDR